MSRILSAIALTSMATVAVASRTIALETDYACYVQTQAGRVVDLTSLCMGQAAAAISTAPVAEEPIYQATDRLPGQANAAPGLKKVNDGKGGYYDQNDGKAHDFNYEIWTDQQQARFTLKVWNSKNYPNGSPVSTQTFGTARAALDHFDCTYAKKAIVACPNNR